MNSGIVKSTLLITLALAGLGVSTPAFAGGKMFKTAPKIDVSLLRQNDKTGEAILHLAAATSYTGCPRVSGLNYKADMNDGFLDIDVTGYTIDFANLPYAPGTPCKKNAQRAMADIPLDRKLVEDNGIKVINIVSTPGLPAMTYDVTMGDNTLTLTPRGSRSTAAPLEFHYYPENTVILSAPVAPAAEQDAIIQSFAAAHGMVTLPTGHGGVHYYIDGQNRLAPANADGIVGQSGTVDIYARKPGQFD